MSLYRVLLADDEEEIRNGIIRKIAWEEHGFLLAGAAENGQEALELAEKIRPDVVMTDIKMPFMDGLTLGRILSERMPSTKLVLFSGFDDFEYAKAAIQIQATEYILKPINSQEITALLVKLRAQLDEEIHEKRDVETLRRNYQKSLPILKDQFLTRILSGRISQARIRELSDQYGMDLQAACYSVAIIRAEAKAVSEDEGDSFLLKQETELIPLSLREIVEENLRGRFSFVSLLYNDDVTVIALLKKQDEILSFVNMMNRICKTAKRFLDLPVSAGIGSVTESLMALKHSYTGACSALDYRVLMGDKAIYIDDMEPDFTKEIQFDEEDERILLNAIKLETPEKIELAFQKLFGKFKESFLPLNQYQIYLTEMLSELIKTARVYKLDMDEVFGKNFKGYSHLSDFESLTELTGWFYEIAVKINGLIKRERMDSAKMIAEKTKQFVEEHYSDSNVSVEMLCDFLHVSPAYFSTIFKRETGTSFITYLTNVRMEQAVRLLKTTDDKTYVISLKVGYTEPNYFSYVFKKHFGVSPSKYRGNQT